MPFSGVPNLDKDADIIAKLAAKYCLLPECFGGLTDKEGQLGPYLKYHFYAVYGWAPDISNPPEKPVFFDDVEWKYFNNYDDPWRNIHKRVEMLKNRQVALLRPLMGISYAE